MIRRRSLPFRVHLVVATLLILATGLIAPSLSLAQSGTAYTIDPAFQSFYDRSGGLPIFGYPVSAPFDESGRLVQYFERQRFELHLEYAGTPYEVLLGRLGAADAEIKDLIGSEPFQPVSEAHNNEPACDFFPETGHRVCHGFRDYWRKHGLEFGDDGVSYRESLALFGFPMSEEFVDPTSGLTIQYFERARFEFHPEHAGTINSVLLGRLGDATWSRVRTSNPAKKGNDKPSSPASATSVPSRTIQSMVDSATPGATVVIPAGIYRETVVINKPLTLQGQPGAEIRGSDDWSSGWTQDGKYWVRGTLPNFANWQHPCSDDSNGRCRWQEQVFLDGQPLYQVAANPAPGQFTVNSSRQVVLADDPRGRRVEVSTREWWILGGANDVTIDGFTMKHAATPAQYGAISNNGHANWTVRNNVLSDVHGAVVSLRESSGLRLINNVISRGGQEGVHGFQANDSVILGNHIFDNNTEQFNAGWEAGGIKLVNSSGVTVDGNEIYRNGGKGFWCDWECRDLSISNNRVHHNADFGIGLEISSDARIVGNKVWENGWAWHDWGWGAGILVQSSRDVEVLNNVVAWNADGIIVTSQNREGYTDVVNNNVHDNAIISTSLNSWHEFALGWLEDYAGPLKDPASNNRGANNSYWHAPGAVGPSPMYEWGQANFHVHQLDGFNRTPGEENGRFLSDAEKDQILLQSSMPTQAEHR